MVWAAMSSAGVGPRFSEVHSQRSHVSENLRALHASFCWQALWRCWFNFPAGLGTCPHYQRYQKLFQWPWCYCAWLVSKLAWPEPHRESMGYSRGRWETPDPAMQMTWRPLSKQRGLHNTWAVPQAACLHAMPHWCSNSCKRRPNQVLSTKKRTYFSEACHFYWKYPFFIDLM